MLIRLLKIAVIVGVVCGIPLAAHARTTVPIRDYQDVPVATGSGKPVTAEQVRQVFIAAGQRGRRPWAFSSVGPDKLIGTLVVRGKHRIEIEVTYTAQHYSVTYKSSEGMNAEGGTIHPSYNVWVNDLLNNVRVALTPL